MSQSLAATHRITITYKPDTLTHKARFFVRGVTPVGGTWNVNTRTLDENDLDWQDAAEHLQNALGQCLPSTTTFGPALLEHYSGHIWQPLAQHSAAATTPGGSVQVASQITLTLRDVQFHKVKVMLIDTNEAAPQHWNTPTGGNSTLDALINGFITGGQTPISPSDFIVSMSNQYLAASPYVMCTISLNKTARRGHGML